MEKSAVTQNLLCASCWERSLLGDESGVRQDALYPVQYQQRLSQGFQWHRGRVDLPALSQERADPEKTALDASPCGYLSLRR